MEMTPGTTGDEKKSRVVGLALLFVVAALWLGAESALGLPSNRAYEQVTPVDKNGGDALVVSARTRASAEGDALGFASLVGFGDLQGMSISSEYMARRTTSGWASHGITPQQDSMSGLLILAGPGDAIYEGEFSPDFTQGVTLAHAFPAGDPNVSTVPNLFVRDDLLTPGPGSFRLVTESIAPIPPSAGGTPAGYLPTFAAASADFRHVIFESILNLTQQAIDAGRTEPKLYEWVDGAVRLVGILPNGDLAANAAAARGATGISPPYTHDAITDDGSRIFFTVRTAPSTPAKGELYVRKDGVTTERIDASERSVPDGSGPSAVFEAATADGRYVFFSSAERLTEDDDNTDADLYRSDLAAPAGARLTRLSVDEVPGDAHTPPVVGVLGVSEDGQRAYFLARGRLSADAPGLAVNTPGIYLWHEGRLSYVGKLQTGNDLEQAGNGSPTWLFVPKLSRVTADGRFALFITSEGDQRARHDHGDCGVDPCREAYVFDAEANGGAGAVVCVSCDPGGGPATGDVSTTVDEAIGGSRPTSHLNRPLSEDGRYAFFHTPERLAPEDGNDVSDAYQYDLVTGEVALISTGDAGADPAYFLDASASGRDVFFASRERLVGWDTDVSYDIYDARIGGGFPEPVRPVAGCADDACQGTRSQAPTRRSPTSVTFEGPGNVRAHHKKARRKCRRGKVRKRVRGRVRCAKKKRRVARKAADR